MTSSYDQYLEGPYAARDVELALFEEWEDAFAPETYELLLMHGEIFGHENEAEEFIPQPFDEWIESKQAEREFNHWRNGLYTK